ncbi:DUF1145 domain-containing protein [Aeromonas hydrophila]|uniref:DUF1145 domain-containing protein n=1 Tax=Aeromonas hydrophila TaxID=644 RepID=UPI001C5BD1C5|nr:DUF1145 domain-containing protein [Aeromonas hydrophila]MBW3810467.1 DUF1145 domain-containing protein [Aeromonas hydrophila]
MKRVFNLLAMGLILFFWFGVLVSLIAPLPGKLNGFLPVCGVIVALMHWVQASMVKTACKPYFAVSRLEFTQVLVFGVFGMVEIRARLQAIVDAKQRGTDNKAG